MLTLPSLSTPSFPERETNLLENLDDSSGKITDGHSVVDCRLQRTLIMLCNLEREGVMKNLKIPYDMICKRN